MAENTLLTPSSTEKDGDYFLPSASDSEEPEVSLIRSTSRVRVLNKKFVQMTLTPPAAPATPAAAVASTSTSSASNSVSDDAPGNSATGVPMNSKSAVWPYFTLTEDEN